MFGLINMNGWLYDPKLRRFLSPDVINQAPNNSQNCNRYSYCLNNPVNFVDLSGNDYGDYDEYYDDDYGEYGIPPTPDGYVKPNYDYIKENDIDDYIFLNEITVFAEGGGSYSSDDLVQSIGNDPIEEEMKYRDIYDVNDDVNDDYDQNDTNNDLLIDYDQYDYIDYPENKFDNITYEWSFTIEGEFMDVSPYRTLENTHDENPYIETVVDANDKKLSLESLNLHTDFGNINIGMDGSRSFGNDVVSIGFDAEGNFTIDISVLENSGVTYTFHDDEYDSLKTAIEVGLIFAFPEFSPILAY